MNKIEIQTDWAQRDLLLQQLKSQREEVELIKEIYDLQTESLRQTLEELPVTISSATTDAIQASTKPFQALLEAQRMAVDVATAKTCDAVMQNIKRESAQSRFRIVDLTHIAESARESADAASMAAHRAYQHSRHRTWFLLTLAAAIMAAMLVLIGHYAVNKTLPNAEQRELEMHRELWQKATPAETELMKRILRRQK